MPDRFVFLPEPSDLFAWFFPDLMIADLQAVVAVPDERLNAIAADLADVEGILDPELLAERVRRHLDDSKQAQAVANTVRNLTAAGLDRLVADLGRLQPAEGDSSDRIAKADLPKLRDKLGRLVQNYLALQRYRKARRLQTASGDELDRVEFLCDLRPVFNHGRDRIEGLVPLVTMRLVAADTDRPTAEWTLTSQTLDRLVEAATTAQAKLACLEVNADRWLPGGYVNPAGPTPTGRSVPENAAVEEEA